MQSYDGPTTAPSPPPAARARSRLISLHLCLTDAKTGHHVQYSPVMYCTVCGTVQYVVLYRAQLYSSFLALETPTKTHPDTHIIVGRVVVLPDRVFAMASVLPLSEQLGAEIDDPEEGELPPRSCHEHPIVRPMLLVLAESRSQNPFFSSLSRSRPKILALSTPKPRFWT